MPDEHDRSRIDVAPGRPAGDRAGRARLRDVAIVDGYAGAQDPPHAFSMALLLDELALHFRDLDDELRGKVVQHCQEIVSHAGRTRRRWPLTTSGNYCPGRRRWCRRPRTRRWATDRNRQAASRR